MTATGPALRPSWMSGRAREYGFGRAICWICGDPDFHPHWRQHPAGLPDGPFYLHYMRDEQGTICTTACAGCSLANGLGDLLAHWPLESREIQQGLIAEMTRYHDAVLGRNVSVAARTDHRFIKFAAATGHEEAQATATGQEKKSAATGDNEQALAEAPSSATGQRRRDDKPLLAPRPTCFTVDSHSQASRLTYFTVPPHSQASRPTFP